MYPKCLLLAAAVAFLCWPAAGQAAITTDLRLGARGPQVIELQNALIARGYLTGTATGNFFSLTRKAVIAFQKAEGLPATGFVGPMTRARLNAGSSISSAGTTTPPVTVGVQWQPTGNVANVPFYVTKNVWQSVNMESFLIPATTTPPAHAFADSSIVQERNINLQTIVFVRCSYIATELSSGRELKDRPGVITGTGVVVSPDGYILTAGHILRIEELVKEDKWHTWRYNKCEVAFIDSATAVIDALDYKKPHLPTPFIPVEVVFKPTEQQCKPSKAEDPSVPGKVLDLGGCADLDFGLLKIAKTDLPYVPLVKKLLILKPGESMIGLGFPGMDIPIGQTLERLDAQFNGYAWQQDSSCAGKPNAEMCGIRYQAKRKKHDYKPLYSKQTDLGKHTAFFRGGFSGGPLLYKGNLVGILVVSRENAYSQLFDFSMDGQWNWAEAASTYEIWHTIQNAGITLPTTT